MRTRLHCQFLQRGELKTGVALLDEFDGASIRDYKWNAAHRHRLKDADTEGFTLFRVQLGIDFKTSGVPIDGRSR